MKPIVNVGTEQGRTDIVYKNEVAAGYMRTAGVKSPALPNDEPFYKFWVHVDSSSENDMVLQKPFVFSLDNPTVKAKMSNWPKDPLVVVKKSGDGYMVVVANTCKATGDAQVYVTLRASALVDGKKKAFGEKENINILSFSYYQTCDMEDNKVDVEVEDADDTSLPANEDDAPLVVGEEVVVDGQVTVEEDGAGLYGFHVSTDTDASTEGDADVVKNGLATVGYEMVKGATGSLTIVPAHEESNTYYVYTTNEEDLDMNAVIAVSDDPTVVTVQISGEMSEERVLKKGEVLPFNAEYTCYKAGSSEVIFTISSPSQPDAKVTFRVEKDCMMAEHEETFVEGLSIGFSATDDSIMSAGVVNKEFVRPEGNVTNVLYKV